MIQVTLNSYDEHFDTYAITVEDISLQAKVKSLIPAMLLPYIAPHVCASCEDLPYDAVGHAFNMHLPGELFQAMSK